ncbi:MAG TPA: phytoene/squalene synthase family protein, partial [Planctomycetaceae bacterium]|nr:phytoene/squalene synthase family protein [Planctomycetaceae bacterium]
MCVLYAFLRLSDDIADEPGRSVSDREVALLDWRDRLRVAMGGGEILPGEPVDVFPALSDVVTSYGIPPEELEAVLDGISMDLTPRIYATYEDLRVYCDRVAGAVGRCCLHVWGFHDP